MCAWLCCFWPYHSFVYQLDIMCLLFVIRTVAMCPLSVALISSVLHSSLNLTILTLCPLTWQGESAHTHSVFYYSSCNAVLACFYLFLAICNLLIFNAFTPSPPTLSDYWKQSKINGLCPPALHSQLHDHMSTTGTMLYVQGDLVVVYLGLHNQFQSLYLTKHAKETGKKNGRPKHCRLGVYYHCTHRYA